MQESCLKTLGVTNAAKSPKIQELKRKNMNEKYGVDYYFQTEEFKEKAGETLIDRYGDKNYRNIEQGKQTKLEKYGDENYNNQEKSKETCLEKYGVKSANQKHILNIDKINDLNFIIENFVDSNNCLDKDKLKEYFNTSNWFYWETLKKLKPFGVKNKKNQKNKKENDFLNMLDETHNIKTQRQFKIEKTRYKVDGYDPETNTVYEFLGDYWHGNPEVYDGSKVNANSKKTFKVLYDETFKRLNKIKKLGYKVKYIWENNYNKNNQAELINL